MRWFKHVCQTRSDEKIAKFFDKCGWEGYGVYWGILEIISSLMCKENGWKTEVTYPLSRWVSMLSLHRTKLSKYILCAEQQGLLVINYSGDTLSVNCPNLLKYKDEYTKKSRHCRDIVGILSGQTPRQDTDTETETETETEAESDHQEFKNCSTAVITTTTTHAPAVITADFQEIKNYFLEQSPAFFPDLPATLKFWSSPKLQGMLAVWAKEGVTLEDVQAAVNYQKAKNDFKDNPYYYANPAIDFARERKRYGAYLPYRGGGKDRRQRYLEEADRNIEIALQQARDRGEIE